MALSFESGEIINAKYTKLDDWGTFDSDNNFYGMFLSKEIFKIYVCFPDLFFFKLNQLIHYYLFIYGVETL